MTRGWTFYVTEPLSGAAALEGHAATHTAEALIDVEDREWAASVTEISLERLLDRVDEIDRENGRL
jgi:hypothetical protein